jgi:secreted repeat protein with Y-X4-D motif
VAKVMSIRPAFDAGHALDTYADDQKPGEVAGQDLDQFGAEWYVLAPDGHKIGSG